MAGDVNNIRWKIGWSPWSVIIGVTVVFTLIGAGVEEVGAFFVLGILAGVITWYWGVREINDKYRPFVKKFIGESERNAKRGIDVEDANLYNLTYNSGSSPLLVEPSDTYYNTTIVVTETSINLNKGAEYDMKSRSGVGGGTNKEIYYDQVTGVQSHQDGAFTELEIKTSGGGSTRISSSATDTVDEVVSEVRQRVREIKNPGSSRRSRREGRGRGAEARQQAGASAESSDPDPDPSRDVSGDSQPSESGASESTPHPVTAVADDVASRTRPSDPLAGELCRVLSASSPDEGRVEDVLEDVVDRLERAGTVADAVADVDDATDERRVEAAKRSLAAQEGPIADGVEPVFERVLELETEVAEARSESASASTSASEGRPDENRREEIAELEAELDRYRRTYDRIEDAAGTVCREAARSGGLTFRTDEVDDRTVELADALEDGELVFDTPGTDLALIVDEVERTVRPQTAQSRELLEVLGDSGWEESDVSAVLESTVETVDEHAELRAAVADIGTNDVRRRLDSLDDELQREEGAVYRHLADRVRELEAMVDRDGVDDVQLYAIYQECTFYDRTLLPRLARSRSDEGSADVQRLASDVESRVATIEDEYVSVRADHNHTIPNHFLSLARDLRREAATLEERNPERAAGILSATDELLGHVEQLYERNEYSVMLRRLRG
ncbi:hypothetical protein CHINAEXTREME_05900 [Halobiforma lacisalsi AJ5]|uniref:Uncharacterized protein n=1 Tax=Natronobacterium lacisalsi AJ5 TaxID=358396 RepID=M0LN02_NATLA|nr:hypothetical protein [Halobiforma lacisalsi]APW97333.1 hypothetical protein CHINAEXTREME_05900 [Halobiforma lacisalsi AJ5]EMA33849.1 hypothetical protein C445_09174 [Halobiforma lacisalsi AJ5]